LGSLILILSVLLFQACDDDDGPTKPEGPAILLMEC